MKKLGYLGLLCATFMFTSSMVGCGGAEDAATAVEEELEHSEADEYGDAEEAVGGALGDMKDKAGDMADGLKEGADKAVEGVKEGVGNAVEGVKEGVGNAVKEGAAKAKEGAANLLKGN